MIINKNQSVRLFLISFFLFVIVFLSLLSFLLGFEVNSENFSVFILIILGEILFCSILYVLLKLINKSQYIVSKYDIKLIKKGEIVFCIKIDQISSLKYYRQIWSFTMQIGAGYLFIVYQNQESVTSQIEIAMTKKTAKKLKKNYLCSLEIF
jgi:hypothetical protein